MGRVLVGAAYFTVRDDEFGAVVAGWRRRELVREWTDTFDVTGAEGGRGRPARCATPRTADCAASPGNLHAQVSLTDEVRRLPDGYGVTVLAMPDSQASRLAGALIDWVGYEPVIAVAAGFASRTWALSDGAFVNDDPDLTLIADDGARRGDGAPILVLHTTRDRAAAHLGDPDAAVAPVLAAARRLLALDDDPVRTHNHRWTFAKPPDTHGDAPYWWQDGLALCGDSWCPSGPPRIEAAWLSGHRLGTAIGQVLGSGA